MLYALVFFVGVVVGFFILSIASAGKSNIDDYDDYDDKDKR